MALEDILDSIRSEAEETASALIDSAQAEADRVLEGARADAEREKESLAGSLDDRARLQRSQIISRAHLQAARERRAARESVYQAARDGVASYLAELRASSDYEEVLGALLDEAMAVLPGANCARADPKDMEVVRRVFSLRGLDLDVESQMASLGGLEIVADGRAVDNRLETRLERADDHLRFIAGELIPDLRGGMG